MFHSRTAALLSIGTVIGVLAALIPAAPALAHSPTRSPLGRYYFSLASDDAHRQVVLFGGLNGNEALGDMWTWNGASWKKRFPAHIPSPRYGADLAYDAATKQFILFGGANSGTYYNDTWMWDGTDWTQLHPAHTPLSAGWIMYDTALGELILFGGNVLYIWDGTDWTEQAGQGPPDDPGALSYDGAGGAVTFGGDDDGDYQDWTFTWDGASWTFRNPVHAPKQRSGSAMTWDPAIGRVLLWGGRYYHDTWTWDGTDWQRHNPAHYPVNGCARMAYDAVHGEAVLLTCSGSTWTWKGKDWHQHLGGSLRVGYPRQGGPPGTDVTLGLWGFAAGESVSITFVDSVHGSTFLQDVTVDGNGSGSAFVPVPDNATPGKQWFVAKGLTSGQVAKARFNVT